MMHCSSVDDLVPVNIQDWVESAAKLYSGDEYLLSATQVASLLTQELRQLVASAELSSFDVSTENVTVFVERGRILSTKSVRFELDALPRGRSQTMRPLAVCHALGRILLCVFSKGRTKSFHPSSGSTCSQESSKFNAEEFMDIDGGEISTENTSDRDAMISPCEDSSASVLHSSNSARSLLLDSGTPLSICRIVCELLDDDASNNEKLEETVWDLVSMKTMMAKEKISAHVSLVGYEQEEDTSSSSQDANFLCETVLLPGYDASEKSSPLPGLLDSCKQEGWFVIHCRSNLDEQAVSQMAPEDLDGFFDRWVPRSGRTPIDILDLNPSLMVSFRQDCKSFIHIIC